MRRTKRLFRPRHSWRRAVTLWTVASVAGWIAIGGLLSAVATETPATDVAAAGADPALDAATLRAWGATMARD